MLYSAEKYIIHPTIHLDAPPYKAAVTVLFDEKRFSFREKYNGTPVIFYVTGTGMERVGTASDKEIILSMIERGYMVVLTDYSVNDNAVSPELDWSVHRLKTMLINSSDKIIRETFIVPAGCNLSLNHVFWTIDEHSAAGTLEKIVEVWNNDFRFKYGERIIEWVDSDGNRKAAAPAFDGSEPIWEDDSHIKIKYTHARKIRDCVKSDGTPIDLNLYMHIIYPERPARSVPVMCLASSAECLALGATVEDRPQLCGFSFRGYAAVMYDHGYVPMMRRDHYYGMMDGKQCVTGDNVTYSIQFHNDKIINAAAMRYVRYLSLSDERFRFRRDAIGVYGNSKGGWMTFLGEKNPTHFQAGRYHADHHGETRFDIGDTEPSDGVRGGKEQPWLTWNDQAIDAHAHFVYPSCGGADQYILKGHAPMFLSGNLRDGACYYTTNKMMNLCRIYDVESIYLEVDCGHTFGYGTDVNHGVDTYRAFFDIAEFCLNSKPAKILYTVPQDGKILPSPSAPFVIKFTGGVPEDEISKIIVADESGKAMAGTWRARFGNTEWSFYPSCLYQPKKIYTVRAQEDIKDRKGGIAAGGTICAFHTAEKENAVFFLVKNDAANTAVVSCGEKTIGCISVNGAGIYALPCAAAPDSAEIEPLAPPRKKTVYSAKYLEGGTWGKCLRFGIDSAPDGQSALAVYEIMPTDQYKNESFYINMELYGRDSVIYENDSIIEELTQESFGKRYHISLRVFDTVSRLIGVELSGCTSKRDGIRDYDRNIYNIETAAGEWKTISFRYDVYDTKYTPAPARKKLMIKCPSSGNLNRPIYFRDLEITEETTEIDLEVL